MKSLVILQGSWAFLVLVIAMLLQLHLWHGGIAHHSGTVDLQEQKIMNMEKLVKLCSSTEENCPGFTKFGIFQILDATGSFSEKTNIGSGGYGTVYKVI